MTTIHLCNEPLLSKSYNNVYDFENENSRNNYFLLRSKKTTNSNIKFDMSRTYFTVNLSYSDIKNFDYLFYKDDDDKYYFYFIDDIEFNTLNTTKIFVSLDVFTTYQFDFTIQPSFVDRCHVPRWNGDTPTYNTEDEGLALGEYIQIEPPSDIYTMEKSVVVCTSVPIGVVDNPIGNSGTGGSGSSWQDGKLSREGFRFIKGFEGFAPHHYYDSGGYLTIAYGVTKHGETSIYDYLVTREPVSEEEGAKISYDLKNQNYGLKILSAVKSLGVTKQNQFDALVSVAYNCGVGAITGDNSLTRAITQDINNETVIRNAWENFKVTSNGIPLTGLVARRKQECNMFFGKEYEVRPISIIGNNGAITGTLDGDGWLPPSEGSTGDLNGYKSFNNDFGNDWLCPVKGATITSKYGWRTHPTTGQKTFHHGTDIGLAKGSSTVASKDGVVSETGFHSSMGNYIYIDSGDYRTKYMHLSEIRVLKGQQVKRGDLVGLIGSTGDSTGPHSHWEIRRISDNESTDPCPNLKVGDKV